MVKRGLQYSKSLLVFYILFVAYGASCQQVSSKEVGSEIATTAKSKQELARKVLTEIGIAQKYDLYLGNSADIVTSPQTSAKFNTWLQGTFAKQAGWKYVEAQYIAQLETNFSLSELKELLNLSKQPLMKKLLRTEILAYGNTSTQRRKLLFQAWDDYNSGKIYVPREVLK